MHLMDPKVESYGPEEHFSTKKASKVHMLYSTMVSLCPSSFICFAYQGKVIVFRFIIEYSSLMDFGP
jgi:hypothetical protein